MYWKAVCLSTHKKGKKQTKKKNLMRIFKALTNTGIIKDGSYNLDIEAKISRMKILYFSILLSAYFSALYGFIVKHLKKISKKFRLNIFYILPPFYFFLTLFTKDFHKKKLFYRTFLLFPSFLQQESKS